MAGERKIAQDPARVPGPAEMGFLVLRYWPADKCGLWGAPTRAPRVTAFARYLFFQSHGATSVPPP